MQHTVCESVLEVNLNEGPDFGTQQVSKALDNPLVNSLNNPLVNPLDKPRLALRDKSDRAGKMRRVIPLVMHTTVGSDVIIKRQVPAKTRKKPQQRLISRALPIVSTMSLHYRETVVDGHNHHYEGKSPFQNAV